jgi:trans-aconitate 2-methyltransferase
MYDWNAKDYAKHSAGQAQWARDLLTRARLTASDRVLDIGCGDGRITAEISRLVPRGEVTGYDLSADMVKHAAETFPLSEYPNLRFMQGDASALPFDGEFTVIYSNAALHWIRNHRPVLAGIARALRPGGRCILEMGGRGNVVDVIQAFEELQRDPRWRHWFEGFESTYGFHGDDDYRVWLREVGLEPEQVQLIDKDMVHADTAAFEGWLRTAWQPYTSPVPPDQRTPLQQAAVQRYLERHPPDDAGRVHVLSVRLQVLASKR